MWPRADFLCVLKTEQSIIIGGLRPFRGVASACRMYGFRLAAFSFSASETRPQAFFCPDGSSLVTISLKLSFFSTALTRDRKTRGGTSQATKGSKTQLTYVC
jgi:hypothetical protein